MNNSPKKVFLRYTEGCCWRRLIDFKLIESFFVSNGCSIVASPEDADLVCLETCAFVKRTEDIAIKEVEALISKGCKDKMMIIGCLPGINMDRLRGIFAGPAINTADIEDINKYFPGFQNKFRLSCDTNALFCQEGASLAGVTVGAVIKYAANYLRPTPRSLGNFVNNIRKIMLGNMGLHRKIYYIRSGWGCEEPFCTYCVEYLAVGSKVTSKPKDAILSEVRKGLSQGYRSFAVIADNVAAWVSEDNETFPDLLEAILGVDKRVVISNIDGMHPVHFLKYRSRMMELIKTRRIKSIVTPVQSGSDRILGLMNRRYTGGEFLDLMVEAKKAYPDIVLITQLIAGFPSETFDEFKRSVDIVVDAGLTNVTVFPYYCNPLTVSAKMEGRISDDERFRRVEYAFRRFGGAGILSFSLGVEINPKFQKTKAYYDRSK